jgi:hypothetical protein
MILSIDGSSCCRRAVISAEAERASREAKSTREVFDQLERVYAEKQTVCDVALKRLGEEVKSSTRRGEGEMAKRMETEEHNKELRLTIDKERVELDYLKRLVAQYTRQKDGDHKELKETIKTISIELNEVKRQLQRKCQDYDELKSDFDGQVRNAERKIELEVDLLKVKINETEKLNRELEASSVSTEKRLQSVLDELKEKYKVQHMSVEARLKSELERFKILSSRHKYDFSLCDCLFICSCYVFVL